MLKILNLALQKWDIDIALITRVSFEGRLAKTIYLHGGLEWMVSVSPNQKW
jgi:hypothetical protein